MFLGTGNAFSMARRYWSSILVNDKILLDASPIVVPHMKALGKKLTELEYIFITHFHGDHFLGIPFLLLDYAYLTEMGHPLNIIGPEGIQDKLTQATDLGFPGVFDKLEDRLKINYFEVTGSGDYDASGFKFRALPMRHGSADAYGYELRVGGKSIGYSGDTDLCYGLYKLAKHVDVLIIELSNPNDDVPGHLSLNKLETLQKHVGKNTKIILNHVGPITGELPGYDNVLLPSDLEVLKF